MINNYPEATKVTNVSENHIIITILASNSCELFHGHFEETPIFPDIGQIDVAINMSSKYFGIEKNKFKDIPMVKFKKIIKPNDSLNLHLTKKIGVISFEYILGDNVASSGRLKYE